MHLNLRTVLCLPLIALVGCTNPPPKNPDSICSIFSQHHDWYQAALNMEQDWGTPVSLAMAFIRQESGFTHDIAVESVFFRLSPRGDNSDPVGYTQAQDIIWQEYEDSTGKSSSRTNFADSLDFIGWYTNETKNRLNIPMSDVRNQYLAFQEGWNGYRDGYHKSKRELLLTASKVDRQARTYAVQMKHCKVDLNQDKSPWWSF
ncbi:hypothetical protein [Veronia pacifica]|uniref:Transglycosylase SLT domain-containing protein n=1 Tax=Veronia pacifica TaxID=1080227 RepID=A0A1C3EB93_9GAMM|nr:hypothetical protein [Veronia pacifica]ODA30505.1 hypothetical protein A8L45_20130 [Veronia pacifica]